MCETSFRLPVGGGNRNSGFGNFCGTGFFSEQGKFRRLRAARYFPSDGKVPKGSPGDAAEANFVRQ